MPTPIEIVQDPLSIIMLCMYGALMAWEALFPGRKLPYVKFWVVRGLAAFVVYFFLSTYLPLFIDPLLEPYRLFDLSGLGTVAGGLLGILVYELGIYLWHYSLHRFNFLWKTFHQMHHSAERLDTFGAFYFSPFDMVGFTVLGSVCFSLLVGLPPQSITMVLLAATFFSIFQHANIKTPSWIGYLIQRPESHTLHHAKGIHRYNYSDLPVFDMLFGTFHNPQNFEHETGFYPGASGKVVDMLLAKDVNQLNPPKVKKVLNGHETKMPAI
jgi:sterol desaturase/sphingolipid hydroxylase (fatty acid hydroxylase superfamily)